MQSRNSIEIESCLELITEEGEQGQTIFYGVNFHLTPQLLQLITQARKTRQFLTLSLPFLTAFRQYSSQGSSQSGLSFYTYYQQQVLIKSIIDLDGDIIHKIHQDCLTVPELALEITYAHHWLIAELLNQLSRQSSPSINKITPLTWILSGVILVIIFAVFSPHYLVWLLFPPLLWLLQRGMKLLLKYVNRKKDKSRSATR